MRKLATLVCVLFVGGCCSTTTGQGETTPDPAGQGDPAAAVEAVTALAVEHCEHGIHGSLDHVSSDGLLIVGTAGEIMEGRSLLEQTNSSYEERGISVRHECQDVQRWVNASASGDVVWVEEALRTHARMPDWEVAFPSQRSMVFERTAEGWMLRYYSLSVRLADDHLDEVFAVAQDGQDTETATETAPETATQGAAQ